MSLYIKSTHFIKKKKLSSTDSVIQKEEERDGFDYAIVRFSNKMNVREDLILFLGLQLIPLL